MSPAMISSVAIVARISAFIPLASASAAFLSIPTYAESCQGRNVFFWHRQPSMPLDTTRVPAMGPSFKAAS